MKLESHILNEIYAHVYRGREPEYALVISHGLGGHGGIYEVFCEHHSAKGADLWSYDAPGHGRSTPNQPRGSWTLERWAQASRDYAAHVKAESGLPVFLVGSSLGVAAATSAIDSPDISGVICMGSVAVPSSPIVAARGAAYRSPDFIAILEQLGRGAQLDIEKFFNFDEDYGYTGAGQQKKLDPYNTWSYDLASWASIFQYDAPVPVADNTKPILFAVGEKDPNFPPAIVEAVAKTIGGPVRIEIMKDAPHQLMLFETEKFSTLVHDFCLANI